MGYVGWVLVRGLRRLRGEQRRLLAGCGGAWVAYQVQSLVSLNVPPLAVLHWVLAAAIIVVAERPQQREFAVPGVRRARRRRSHRGRPASVRWPRLAVAAAAAAAIWPVRLAVRADVAAGSGTARAQQGAVADAVAELEHAVGLAPYRSNTGYISLRCGRRQETRPAPAKAPCAPSSSTSAARARPCSWRS